MRDSNGVIIKKGDWVEFKHNGTEDTGKVIGFETHGYIEIDKCEDGQDPVSIHSTNVYVFKNESL